MRDKRELRAYIRSQHQGEVSRKEQSRLICQHILASDVYRSAYVIAGYVPLKWEADITPVLADALRAGKCVVLPRCRTAPDMTLHRIAALSDLVSGAYGIPEPPDDSPEVRAEDVDLVLVPLEGIDSQGYRLGKGGGYYDRLLADRRITAVGCALIWQCVESAPREPWDIPLSMCATQDGIRIF